MELLSACPFTISTLSWEGAPGQWNVSVAARALLTLAPSPVLATHQEPMAVDRSWDDDPRAGLVTSTDRVPFKPRVDILASGHAYAPGGAPAESLVARLWLGTVRKALSINGDRSWVPSFDGLRPSVPVPFRRMALRYDRAVMGGDNLGGVDILTLRAEVGRPLPNIAAIAETGSETPGFGPLPLLWRARRMGQSDAAVHWASRAGLGGGAPPPGFDFRIFNAAPAEQQIELLPPGAPLLLENLHPEHPRFETRLPMLRVRIFHLPPGGSAATGVLGRCDTLAIDTDQGTVALTFRATLPATGPDGEGVGTILVAAEGDGERFTPDQAERLIRGMRPEVRRVSFDPRPPDPRPFEGGAYNTPREIQVPREPSPSTAPIAHSDTPPPPTPTRAMEVPAPKARPITVPPRSEVDPVSLAGLPFRAPPTGFEALPAAPVSGVLPPIAPPRRRTLPSISGVQSIPAPEPSSPVLAPVEDAEVTPPRGRVLTPRPSFGSAPPAQRTSSPPNRTGPLPPPMEAPPIDVPASLRAYAAARLESWEGRRPLAEVLSRRGLADDEFAASERAELDAIAREAATGEATRALALLAAFSLEKPRDP